MEFQRDLAQTITTATPIHVVRTSEPLNLSWRHPNGLFYLSWVNFALRLVTLGIYHFWAKTEVRKRLWSAIRINDEPLTYTGRGLELFLGFVIVALIVLLPATLIIAGSLVAFGPKSVVYNLAVLSIYMAAFFLFGMAIYRAMRYRLARTRWRGIRGALVGSPLAYAWTYFWTMLLVIVTVGWMAPWRDVKLQNIMTNNMRFGDRPFRFTATSGPLYEPFSILWFVRVLGYIGLMVAIAATVSVGHQRAKQAGIAYIPTVLEFSIMAAIVVAALLSFAAVGAWYQARVINHFANHTHFENATFRGNLTGGGLIWLTFNNYLILLAGALMVLTPAAMVALPFVGFDADQLVQITTNPAMQSAASVAPLVIVVLLGLLMPVVQARSLRYTIENLSIEGTAPLADIIQLGGPSVKLGEGLAEAFDIDAF